jgi:23S rRNA pseudoU1915 N3-methylase RlmH
MEAKAILSKSQSVSERAEDFFKRIARNLQKDIIDVLEEKVEKINDKILETKDFSLDTNLNKGQQALTMSECQERFETLIKLEYEKELLERELAIKQSSYNKYFKAKE